ncbi:Poly(ADP-ribose) glycohydrolase isoform [Blastomyces dermatitidis ATCC 18188]|nr:Poly(ADP-ribose) glycohydrolase isoform [Blastomyces dermatitidis ATCC 18188]
MRFTLPCSPSLLCIDRFSLLESEAYEVPFWQIFRAAITARIEGWGDLVGLLETIAVTLHSSSLRDYDTLRGFLQDEWASKETHFFTEVWPELVRLALEMPQLFPESSLLCLSEEHRELELSRRQVGCLVIHQFLCSLPKQPWATDSSQDFRIWYSSGSRHLLATRAYLSSLFTYFQRLSGVGDETQRVLSPLMNEWRIIFTLRILQENQVVQLDPSLLKYPLCRLTVVHLPTASTEPSLLGLPDGACVISANKNVGFGHTGTQEETQVGSSPESCPVVLLTPTLQNNQVLIVQGAEAMVTIKGYGREARLDSVLTADYGFSAGDSQWSKWRRRTMLFMDALQLDQFIVDKRKIADHLPGHVDRELLKAYNAFSSSPGKGECKSNYTEIVTGLWGCGAFGGNPQTKTLIQWCAASMAQTNLRLVLSGEDHFALASELNEIVKMTREGLWTVKNVLDTIGALKPYD